MSDTLSQANRTGILTTPFGTDQLVLASIHAIEGLSQCFSYMVGALSSSKDLDFNSALGQHCTVAMKTPGGQKRHFDGLLTEAIFLGPAYVTDDHQTIYSYHLVLRPWFWLLSHKADCRIFQHKTVVDIILKVFRDAGFSDFEIVLGSYPELEYCVQYRESDFAFVSRLMEEFGIYYYFKHEDKKHTMVLVDAPSAHQPIPTLAGGKIPYRAHIQQTDQKEEVLTSWNSSRRFRSGKFTLNDYDYLKPDQRLLEEKKGFENYGHRDKSEVYDYPGKYADPNVGEKLAAVRLQSEEAGDHRRHAGGEGVSLFPGGKITVTGNDAEQPPDFLVVNAQHSFRQQSYRSGHGYEEESYHGDYELLPALQQFRAPQVTPRPRIYGIQTAVVVGPSGEEIFVDKYGRIVVQFHWDREGKKDANSSLPIRVAEMWSSKQWGGQFIPRIGMEVVVEFLEGDPDRPLVTGTVYNAKNMHPFELPTKKTQSGVKSATSMGSVGFNEIMFEDKKGQENFYMHAERDHEIDVKNDETRRIVHKLTTTIGYMKDGQPGIQRGSPARETNIKHGDDVLTVDIGNRNTDIQQGDDVLKVDMGNRVADIKMGDDVLTLDQGNQKTQVELGSIEEEAFQKIELRVGESTLTIDQTGITLEGMMITIKGQIQVNVQGMMTQVQAGAILQINGGITMIN